MDENLSRLALLVGEESLERIREKTVLLCGCGGVGSFVAEALARSGLGHIILVDDDFVEPSNLNRQLMTTKDNIGIKKVKALEKRLSQISDIEVKAWDLRIDENFKMPQVDYVIDCIDDLKAKFILAKKASFLKLPFIASMGSAKRLAVGEIKYTSLDKTRNDPLAKAYRQLVKKENYHRAIRVVYMDTPPLKQVDNRALGSAIFAVGACGLKIAAIVFADLIKGDKKMKFKDFKYEHLDYETLAKTYQDLLEPLKKAQNVDDFMTSFKAINRFRGHIQTMMSLVNVRHTIDTSDPYYDAENNYWDETSPRLQVFEDDFFATALACPFREKLPIPATFFKLLENARKSFDPQIIEELQEENRLATAYGKLKASAQIAFRGQIYNLASINTFINDADRNVRKEAYDAMMTFYNEHEDEFDEIFDQMVKVRDRMARKLGYENFIDLAYLRMNRLDYDQKMVEDYRRQVVEYMVPVANELYQRQAKRIGVSKLMAYDAGFEFKSGNPKPRGNKDELLNKALKMYSEMSKESGEYFKMMCDMELFDLETRPHKEMGGYCTDFYDYKVPFIFANFNGTQGDVDVLTHEAGHGFQVYLAMQAMDIPDISFPTYESCEIHSMSMEFFAHPWMELFFGEDAEKYKFYHVASALTFVPYGCLVDHFQHEVYARPKMSKAERKETFRRLEKIYKPHLDYSGYPLLERGGFFYRQGHVFQNPFYYIDYTLAQVCALQFFKRTLENDPHAWEDYVHLCRLGGSKSFLELVEEAGLKSPFAEGTIAEVVEAMVKVLNIDDAKL